MSYQIICELFLLVLLGISCARIFFIKIAHQDPLSVLPILAFIMSLLNILAFGVTVFGCIIVVLSLLITLWNANALSRFSHKLVVDHYGMLFTLASIVNLILIIVLAVFIILLRPAKINTKKYGVKITSETYAGTAEDGFFDYTSPSQYRSIFIKKYTSIDEKQNPFDESRVIVFIPSEISKTDLYEPFFVKLARDGYTIYSADFYTKDIKWFGNIWDFKPFRRFALLYCKFRNPEMYQAAISQKTDNFTKEILALTSILPISKSDKILVVGDGESQDSYTAARIASNNRFKATFDLSTISSYSTPGFGPVESTDPLLAKFLGLERDATFYMSSHVAGILENSINEVFNPKPKEESSTTDNPESEATEEN